MALTKSNYAWNGLTITGYAKITERVLTEDGLNQDGTKRYRIDYAVNVYTSPEKLGDVRQESFTFHDGEATTIAECYTDLKTREAYSDWADA